MRPGTRHYVLTLEPSLVFGKHFYCGTTLQRSVEALIHTILSDDAITNTCHPELIRYIPANLSLWRDMMEKQVLRPDLAKLDPRKFLSSIQYGDSNTHPLRHRD